MVIGTEVIIQILAKSDNGKQVEGKQMEPNVKTLRSPLSVKFSRYCLFSGETDLSKCGVELLQERRNKINKYFIPTSEN